MDHALEVMPLRIAPALGNALQQLVGLNDLVEVDEPADVTEFPGIVAVVIAVVAGRGGIAASIAPGYPHRLDHVVGFIDLPHFFLCQVSQRVVGIVIRVIFFRQLPVCRLDLIITGIGGYSQNFVGISHIVFSFLDTMESTVSFIP